MMAGIFKRWSIFLIKVYPIDREAWQGTVRNVIKELDMT